ncbi:MAG: 30S ribosomal protein S6 [Desulfomicrobium escambiense]|nr:30S ribosomal protein S6 [Desulfomicrobium escambiense]
MRQYETGFVLSPTLSEEETTQFLQQMAEIVAQKKGRMVKQDVWGKRRLAFPIKRFQEGFYVFFTYDGPGDVSARAGAPVQAVRRRHPVHDGRQGPAGPRPAEEESGGPKRPPPAGRRLRPRSPAEVKSEEK